MVKVLSDSELILSHRYDNGADLWTTPTNNLCKGAPFSTLESVYYLLELGFCSNDPIITAVADLIFSTQRPDGRFKIASSSIYPCQTAHALNVLCHMGYARDDRLNKTYQHLLASQANTAAVVGDVPIAKQAGAEWEEIKGTILLTVTFSGVSGVLACLKPAKDAFDL